MTKMQVDLTISIPALDEIAAQMTRIADMMETGGGSGGGGGNGDLPKPGPILLVPTGEFKEGDKNMLKFKFSVPEETTADVDHRELKVTIGAGGPSQQVVIPGKAAAETEEFMAEQGETVYTTMVNWDDAGNHSDGQNQTWTITDTIAPPAPGQLGVIITGEE